VPQAEVDGHDDEVRSRGSSASSSPRYPAAMLSHLAASMSASNRGAAAAGSRGGPRHAGGHYPSPQQPVYGLGGGPQHTRMPLMSSPQDGMAMAGSPAYLPAPSHAQNYAAQRASPMGAHGYRAGWPQQGALQAVLTPSL
jgi:hypothetical protein